MKTENNFARTINWESMVKYMFWGATVAFIAISFFVFGTESDPAWGEFWMVRPLIITPLAGACGGAFFYFIESRGFQGDKRILGLVFSILVYLIGLWMGIVLGLDGTLWN